MKNSKVSPPCQTKGDGMFIDIDICGIETHALLDSGSTITVIKPETFEQIESSSRPPVKPGAGNLRMANGQQSQPVGRTILPIKIPEADGLTFTHDVVIANIEVPVILGKDFMKANNFQLNLGEDIVTVGSFTIKCKLEQDFNSVFRIVCDSNVVINPNTEVIIGANVCIDKLGADDNVTSAVIDNISDSLFKKGILVAKTVINPANGKVPLRLMNLSEEIQTVYANTTAAFAEPVELIESLQNTETNSTNQDRDMLHLRTLDQNSDNLLEQLPEHLHTLWENNISKLNQEQKVKFCNLLIKHQNVFAKSKYDLGRTDIVQHKIDTGDSKPIKQPMRRLPLNKREVAEKEIQNMLAHNIIEPSTSPWASPICLATKKDGSTRFCVDFRAVNLCTIRDSYPLPNISDCFDTLGGGTKWFSTIDLQSGYWQVAMDPEDKEKTAFTCPSGLFQFKVLPFGCCNGPPLFERLMEHVLSGLQWTICLLYLDDVICFSKTFEEHLDRLDQILTRLREAGLKISTKKCHFFQSQVGFLGHIVSEEGVSTDPEKISVVKNWPTPKTVKQLKSYLGFCSYYRKYVPSFSDIARPLNKLCEKSTKQLVDWSQECQESFEKLKHLLTSTPILSYPTVGEPYILDTDASSCAAGSVLSQVIDGKERVIAYYSKTFQKSEVNYCITRRELLAIILSVKHFHNYLYGSKVLIRTDHGALSWLLKFKNPEGQLARWIELLSEYDFKIQFRPGRLNNNADGMSRLPCGNCGHCQKKQNFENAQNVKEEETISLIRKMKLRSDTNSDDNDSVEESVPASQWVQSKSPDELKDAQQKDPSIKPVLDWLAKSAIRPTWRDISPLGSASKYYFAQWDRLKIKEGILYREYHDRDDSVRLQLVLPTIWRTEVMTLLHNDICAGHLGITKTIARVRSRYYWVGFKEDITNHCNQCFACQARKMPSQTCRAGMKTYNVGIPMERVAIDILGPLPQSRQGNRFILVITDYFTKWTEAIALPSITADIVANKFIENIVTRFGIPREIHTDQGRQFESKLFQSLCQYLNILKTRATPFHPQSDGAVERFNRTIEDMLSKYISPSQKDWDELLPLLLMAYRSSEHDSTKMTPNMLMLGREVNLPADLLYPPPPGQNEKLETYQYIGKFQDKLTKVHEIAREKMLKASEKQKLYYDHRSRKPSYAVGDPVWLRIYKKTVGKTPKLQFKWEGPYKVVAALSDVTVKIQKTAKAPVKVIHVNKLKPYQGKLSSWFN